MARNKGDEDKLWTLKYSQIAEWTGLEVSTLRTYATRGQFKRDDIESVLEWVNARRQAAGIPLIGEPENKSEENTQIRGGHLGKRANAPNAGFNGVDSGACGESGPVSIASPTDSGYNPRTGGYEE